MSSILDWFNPKPPVNTEQTSIQEPSTEQTTQESSTEQETTVQETTTQEPSTEQTTVQETTTQETTSSGIDSSNGFYDDYFKDNEFDIGINEGREEEKNFEDNNIWKPSNSDGENFWVDDSFEETNGIPLPIEEYNPSIEDGAYTGIGDEGWNDTVVEDQKIQVEDKMKWGVADKSTKGFGEAQKASDRLGSQNVRKEMTLNRITLSNYEPGFMRAEPKQLQTLSMIQLPEPVITTKGIILPTLLIILSVALIVYIKISGRLFIQQKEDEELQEEKEKMIEEFKPKNLDFDELFRSLEEDI